MFPRLSALAVAAAMVATLTATADAEPLAPAAGSGSRIAVVGHSSLPSAIGQTGLNGDVAVLGTVAFVGFGTNGGFAAQWNKTPMCRQAGAVPGTVKVVNVAEPTNPVVLAEIKIGDQTLLARDVAAIRVEQRSAANTFVGDLLAVAVEACGLRPSTGSTPGIHLFDVTNPASPILVGRHAAASATREVSLVQGADGKVLAYTADQGEGVRVIDVTDPAKPTRLSTFGPVFAFGSTRECRPFLGLVQGVSVNQAGTKAYSAFYDSGLLVHDTSIPSTPIELSRTEYAAREEGNSFRFVPNATERAALATDDDPNPARTTVTARSGAAALFTEPGGTQPGVFRACEAVWGGPLYERATPEVSAEVVHVGFGCNPVEYAGRDLRGKIVLTDRGGFSSEGPSPTSPCFFDERARRAQEAGAVGVLIASTNPDYNVPGGSGVLLAPDSTAPGDGGVDRSGNPVSIPVAMITMEAGAALKETPLTVVTIADQADTWGALRVFDLTGARPAQVATVETARSRTLTPGEGRHHATEAIWDGNFALVAWMSDGLQVLNLADPASPRRWAAYVPPAAADATGNYGTVPLVAGVAKLGTARYVVSDVNAGLYVVDVLVSTSQCKDEGWKHFGFANQRACADSASGA